MKSCPQTSSVVLLPSNDGFRLTYLGYDFLAIKTMVNRGVFTAVGRQIGVGKESDIFEVSNEDGTVMAMKLHRLGRTSFRAVKSKRDYLRHRSSFNWLYLSRLAALKEFAFMKALEEHGFPVPNAVDCNRHCVVMSLIQGYPLCKNPETVFETIIGLVVRLAEHGLIHCDFNEFNIMIDDDEKVIMIDFPQMVSVSHRNAQMFNLSFEECSDDIDDDESSRPSFSSITKTAGFLDKELAASGFTRKDEDDIQKFIEGDVEEDDVSDGEHDSELCQTNIKGFDSLHLDQEESTSRCNEEGQVVENLQSPEVGQRGDPESQNLSSNEGDENDDTELVKSLAKQRRRAMAAARKGHHKNSTSRNSYKDKGDARYLWYLEVHR
ncbi:hypothetical protein GOBAR_DD14984 [Gossypium barbadense]|nr:hypothetical protein GOBAR_DD14984 [Gossypium barbadense]